MSIKANVRQFGYARRLHVLPDHNHHESRSTCSGLCTNVVDAAGKGLHSLLPLWLRLLLVLLATVALLRVDVVSVCGE